MPCYIQNEVKHRDLNIPFLEEEMMIPSTNKISSIPGKPIARPEIEQKTTIRNYLLNCAQQTIVRDIECLI